MLAFATVWKACRRDSSDSPNSGDRSMKILTAVLINLIEAYGNVRAPSCVNNLIFICRENAIEFITVLTRC